MAIGGRVEEVQAQMPRQPCGERVQRSQRARRQKLDSTYSGGDYFQVGFGEKQIAPRLVNLDGRQASCDEHRELFSGWSAAQQTPRPGRPRAPAGPVARHKLPGVRKTPNSGKYRGPASPEMVIEWFAGVDVAQSFPNIGSVFGSLQGSTQP